jgi:hypothetical protein
MNSYILRLLKGSRHTGLCGRCRQPITWAICAPRGRSVPLIASPIILREERNARDVVYEVVGGDQVHECPVRPAEAGRYDAQPRRHRKAGAVFATFSPDRMQQLRDAATGAKRMEPSPQRELF